jgi:hypothetical protein
MAKDKEKHLANIMISLEIAQIWLTSENAGDKI